MYRKTKIVISDTHIGAGGDLEGNKLEDFISDSEFLAWIRRLIDESNQQGLEIEFIINGDWIEFLQVPAVDQFEPGHIYDASYYTDVSEEAALQRLEIVQKWHSDIFVGLSDFLNPGLPRRTLTILFGNHDPELVYPKVQERLREMLHANGAEKDLVSFGPRYYFRDGVYVEHGNAYGEAVNKFTNPDLPFDPKQPSLIERPSGSHFVTRFFNQLEWERPWVDGVHPLTSLIFYALAYEPVFALRVLKAFLEVAPNIFVSISGAPAEGAGNASQQVLIQIASEEQQATVAQQLQSDPDFARAFQAQVQQALTEKGMAPTPPLGIAGAPSTLPPQVHVREITEYYWQLLEEAADRIARERGAQVVLFGHIHERVHKQLPSGATYLNTGTWVWKGDFSKAPDRVWQDLLVHPDKYSRARELSYARIDYDENGVLSNVQLLRVGDAPSPPPAPGPLPQSGWWAKFLLALRSFWQRFFAK